MNTLTIRMAVPGDAPALRRLAELDSVRAPEAVPTLVALADGEICAALPLNGRNAIADPFRPTAETVAMLAARARQLEAPTRARGRLGPMRIWRAARAGADG